ncbi:MAG: hypothetical protein AAFZ07_03790 [Actinomycetota bacterium]
MSLLFLILLAAAAVVSVVGPRFAERAGAIPDTSRASIARERAIAAYWAAVRHDRQGLSGMALQEAICRSAGCSPAEADAAMLELWSDEPVDTPPWL